MAGNKILIVEDDKTLLDALRYNLSKEGYTIVAATEGVQAIEVARSEKPDHIILDFMLPKLDGFKVCREKHNIKVFAFHRTVVRLV